MRSLWESVSPGSFYNYSAIRNRLAKQGIVVALSTIIDRVKSLDCYQTHPRKKVHDREVVTTAIDSTHLWAYSSKFGKKTAKGEDPRLPRSICPGNKENRRCHNGEVYYTVPCKSLEELKKRGLSL